MPLLADRVKETTTTTGTGQLTLAGAPTGFQSFTTAFGNGASVYYVIAGGADWEIGIGTTGAGTLTRETVLQSTNADALVDFAAGVKDVFCSYVADRAVTTSDTATLTNKTIDSYTNDVGANSTHFRIKASETLAKGDVIRAVGFTPGENAIEVVKVASSSEVGLGICEQALNSGQFGMAVVIGELLNVNTNGFTVNQTLYSNGTGGFTSTKPSSGLYQVLGWVVRANTNNGVIAVNVVSPLYVEASTNTANTSVLRDGSGNFAAGTITAALTGNASTATTLQTARNINGVSFNGSADITVPAAAGTLTGSTLASGVTASSLTSVGTLTSLAVSGVTTLSAGTVSDPALTTAGDTNTGVFFPAADTIAFTEGGVEAMRLDSAGRVGIGTTTPAARLDVIGAVSAQSVEFDGTTSGTVTVQPAATAGTWALTLPTGAGTNGQVLTTNGSGVTSWATPSTARPVVAVTPTTGNPYVITASDAGKRVQVNTSAAASVEIDAPDVVALPNGTTIEVAAYGGAGAQTRIPAGSGGLDIFYNPQANIAVTAIGLQSDSKAIIGGLFTTIGATTRQYIARLNSDGTLDTGYDPSADNTVRAIAIQTDGKALVGGAFTSVAGLSRNRIARLNTDGTADAYNPNANGGVLAIAIQSDGKAIVAGAFTTIGGTTRNRIARINTDGTLDTSYNPNVDFTINAVALQSDGKAIIVGDFSTVGGVGRNYIARLNTDGTLDTSYTPATNSQVFAVAIQSDGKALLGGNFTTMAGSTRNRIARLNTDGTLDAGYNPNADSIVRSIAVQTDGRIIVGGDFTLIGGVSRNRLARTSASGTVDPLYNVNLTDSVEAIAIQASGKAVVVGNFTLVAPPRARILRMEREVVTINAAYTLGTYQVPRYGVLTFEKVDGITWWVTESNAS